MRNLGLVVALVMSATALWFSFWPRTVRSAPYFSRDERGVFVFEGISDDLEILGYSGGKATVSLANVKPNANEHLWYLRGYDVLKGTGDTAKIIKEDEFRLEDIEKVGGKFGELPNKIQQVVIHQRHRSAAGETTLRGKLQLKTLNENSRGRTATDFDIPIPAGASGKDGGLMNLPDVSLDALRKGMRIVLRKESYVPYDAHGQEDPANAITIHWHVSLKLVPDKNTH